MGRGEDISIPRGKVVARWIARCLNCSDFIEVRQKDGIKTGDIVHVWCPLCGRHYNYEFDDQDGKEA